MDNFFRMLIYPLGLVLRFGYIISGSFGLALIFFALVAKVVTFPLVTSAQKNAIKLARIQPELDHIKRAHYGDKQRISEEQYELHKREAYSPLSGLFPLLVQLFLLIGMVNVVHDARSYLPQLSDADFYFLGVDLQAVPSAANPYVQIILPILSGLSSYALCLVQNMLNPAQRRMHFFGRWGMAIPIIILSVYIPLVMPAAIGLYWLCGNTLGIVVALCVNALHDPRKLLDAELLKPPPRPSRAERNEKKRLRREKKALEGESLERFYASDERDKLVFYAISGGQYKYFSEIVDYLLENSDITIHYVTNDFNDPLFKQARAKFELYYIGERRAVTFMLKLDAKMVIMTAPNLQEYHIKRSIKRPDAEYVFCYHHFTSLMLLRERALDHFDTVFLVGKHQLEEIRRSEAFYALPRKTLVKAGYGQIDKLLRLHGEYGPAKREKPQILIAPSWQTGNILDSCLARIVDPLTEFGHVIIRPHPEYVKRFPDKWQNIVERFSREGVTLDADFLSNDTIYQSDIMITDWSGIVYEFSYCTKRPTICINTAMKVMNSEYHKLGIEPIDITLRGQMGAALDLDSLGDLPGIVSDMLENTEKYRNQITATVEEYLYHPGRSGEAAGRYIVSRLDAG